MHVAGGKRHCFTVQILDEAAVSGEVKNKKYQSPQRLLDEGKAKAQNPPQPTDTKLQLFLGKAFCPTFVWPKLGCYTNKVSWAKRRPSKKEHNFEGNS